MLSHTGNILSLRQVIILSLVIVENRKSILSGQNQRNGHFLGKLMFTCDLVLYAIAQNTVVSVAECRFSFVRSPGVKPPRPQQNVPYNPTENISCFWKMLIKNQQFKNNCFIKKNIYYFLLYSYFFSLPLCLSLSFFYSFSLLLTSNNTQLN